MGKNWDEGICNEKAGFLFSHACPKAAEADCQKCGKPVCRDHMRESRGRALCINCTRKEQDDRDDYYDDHYFYGGYHYDGYYDYSSGHWGATTYYMMTHHDRDDFTEADAASLASESSEVDADDFDDGDFENDMSES